MKKTLMVVLSLLVVFLNFGTIAKAMPTEKEPKTEFRLSAEAVEEGDITAELLKGFSSWKELYDELVPMQYKGPKHYNSYEDWHLVNIMDGISRTMTVPVYHNMEYTSFNYGGLDLKEVSYDRFMNKVHDIIDVYNKDAAEERKLVMDTRVTNSQFLSVELKSQNTLFTPATQIGQRVKLKKGTKYWESAYGDGSGKYGILSEDIECNVTGYAYLDENRENIIESYVGDEKKDIFPWENRLVHISTDNTDLGWVWAEECDVQEE